MTANVLTREIVHGTNVQADGVKIKYTVDENNEKKTKNKTKKRSVNR